MEDLPGIPTGRFEVCQCGQLKCDRNDACTEHTRVGYAPGGIASALWGEINDVTRTVVSIQVREAFAGESIPHLWERAREHFGDYPVDAVLRRMA